MTPPAALAAGFSALGLDLLRTLGAGTGNLVVSPISIASALALTWAGARGETADEIARALRLSGPRSETLTAASTLAKAVSSIPEVELALANRLFTSAKTKLEPEFLATTERAFRAGADTLDFASDPEAARRHINAWTARATKDRVVELLPSGSIDRDTRLVIDTAVYLNAKWAEPFEKERTRPASFHAPSGARRVQTMSGVKYTSPYTIRPELRAIELPYAGQGADMLVIVPADAGNFGALEASLSPDRVASIAGGLDQTGEVLVKLPRVDLAAGAGVSLVPGLRAAGIDAALDRERADFTGITDPPSRDDRLFVADAFHAASIRIDEAGTEAAAATAVIFGPLGAAPQTPPTFEVDRPFFYFVRERTTGAVLFAGKVVAPAEE